MEDKNTNTDKIQFIKEVSTQNQMLKDWLANLSSNEDKDEEIENELEQLTKLIENINTEENNK